MNFSEIIKESSSKDWSLDIFTKRVVIFGCGNVLFGDDGFGPQVIEYLLAHYKLPEDVYVLDVGTSIRSILFDLLLSPQKPQKVILIDAVQFPERAPGEIFEIDVDGMPTSKTPDFSIHQGPTINFLKELKTLSQLDVHIVVVQAKYIPDQVEPGLSEEVQKAVPEMCIYLKQLWGQP
ncbi:MAG: hydrogenase maturation protease [Candidatus Desulfofervidaceae bacterium]|nr:hydrogenase maturation protease [Candidatus Desulfofervidaceae bacterium]MDL1969709.1 hydrogenase maturation protease [Candidatus Desulfofervidaceae bacterium]